ncbi:MAG: N-6 DNA methylase [Veillonellales bacterium]
MEKELFTCMDILRGEVKPEMYLFILSKYLVIRKAQELGMEGAGFECLLREERIQEAATNLFNLINKEYVVFDEKENTIVNSDSGISNRALSAVVNSLSNIDKSVETVKLFETLVVKFATEYITPACITQLGIKILAPISGSFYDGTAGLNGSLIEAQKYAMDKLDLYGEEINTGIYELGKIYAFLNDVKVESKQGHVLLEPIMAGDRIKQHDYVMMDPPFGLNWKEDKDQITKDEYNQFAYGLPTLSSADLLFVSHMIKTLKENGKGIIIGAHGRLFRGAGEQKIREKLLIADYIEAVISLPGGLYSNTMIPVNLLVINKNKSADMKNKILFINAEEMGVRTQYGKNLSEDEINKIAMVYKEKVEQEEFSVVIDTKDIQDANLLPSRYIYVQRMEIEGLGLVKFNWVNIPDGINFVSLQDIAQVYRGINITSDIKENNDGKFKIINIADVQNGKLNVDNLTSYDVESNAHTDMYLVQQGDVIITARGVTTKVCVIPEVDGNILLSQNFYGIRLTNKSFISETLKMYLESPVGKYLLSQKQVGTAIAMLNIKDLKELSILSASVEQQKEAGDFYEREMNSLEMRRKQLEIDEQKIKLDTYKKLGINTFFELVRNENVI